MTFRQYAIVMSLASGAAWTGWILVIALVDPITTGAAGLILFYISISTALIGTLALVGLAIRFALFRGRVILSREVSAAFRQSVFITILIVGSLVLRRFSLLTWWTSALLVLALGSTELFLFTSRPARRPLPETDEL